MWKRRRCPQPPSHTRRKSAAYWSKTGTKSGREPLIIGNIHPSKSSSIPKSVPSPAGLSVKVRFLGHHFARIRLFLGLRSSSTRPSSSNSGGMYMPSRPR